MHSYSFKFDNILWKSSNQFPYHKLTHSTIAIVQQSAITTVQIHIPDLDTKSLTDLT